jgi:hypothetical protein
LCDKCGLDRIANRSDAPRAATDASIALNRFGLGARADESVPDNPKAWLKHQIEAFDPRPAAIAAVPPRAKVAGELADFYEQQRQLRQMGLGRRRQQQRVATAPMPQDPPGMAPPGAPQDMAMRPAVPVVPPGTPEPGAKPDADDPL